MRKISILILTFFSISSYAAKDVELSWEKSYVFIPGYFFSRSVDVVIEKKYPVVIYLHGCNGINFPHDPLWAKELNSLGFVVMVLDSFARPDRKSNCDIVAKQGNGKFLEADRYRQEEINYAYKQLKKLSWVDTSNIFLMGFSEGGRATALSKIEFKASIIMAWNCTSILAGDMHGINTPKGINILAITHTNDPWFTDKPTSGRCIDQDEHSRLTQLDLEGNSHETYQSKSARKAVSEFLLQNLN